MQERASAGIRIGVHLASSCLQGNQAPLNPPVVIVIFGVECGIMAATNDVEMEDVETALSQRTLSDASTTALAFIEHALDQVQDQMQRGEDGNPVIYLRRLDGYDAVLSQDQVSTEFKAKDHPVKYSWPGNSSGEAWRFGLIVPDIHWIH